MTQKLAIVKVGGQIVEQEAQLRDLLKQFAALEGLKILVHGGGRTATELARRLGIETRMVEGRRVTDERMLRVVTMVYGGLVNKNVVARLQSLGINALGLTGADMNLIRSHRRPLKNGTDFGFVGDVDRVDGERLAHLLLSGITPVLSPLTHNGQGVLLNTNADTIAAETAKSLASRFRITLIYCFEHAGVLSDPEDETSVIREITPQSFLSLKEKGVVSDGMLPKIENALSAVRAGVSRVVVTCPAALGKNGGTSISAD